MTADLQGLRIMVVEDEYLVASLIEQMLEIAGCEVAGPIPRLAEAVQAAKNEACDAAILDVNLAGQQVVPVAEILSRRNIPFLFVTGYGSGSLPAAYAGCPRLGKPFKTAELLDAVSDLVRAAGSA